MTEMGDGATFAPKEEYGGGGFAPRELGAGEPPLMEMERLTTIHF